MIEHKQLADGHKTKLKCLRKELRQAHLKLKDAEHAYNQFVNECILDLDLSEHQGISEAGEVILDAKAYAIDKLRSLKPQQIQEVMQAITQAANKG